jgi:hypothetical protein
MGELGEELPLVGGNGIDWMDVGPVRETGGAT